MSNVGDPDLMSRRPSEPAPRPGKMITASRWRWLGVATAALAAVVLIRQWPAREFLSSALDHIGRLGAWGPVLFVGLYIIATVLFIPGSVLTLGAGAVFGVVSGSIYVSIGSTLGATAAFLVGRYVARETFARRLAGYPTFAAIDRAVAAEGWKVVALTRLSPVFPFNLLNYAYGLSCVPLRDYVIASWIGMMPATVLYVYLGSLAGAAATGRTRQPLEWALYAIGLAATAAVTIVITRRARRALKTKIIP